MSRFRFDEDTKMLSDTIKYCSLSGCKNKSLWNKLLRSIYKIDYSNKLHDLAITINYLSKANIKTKTLSELINE